MAGRSSGNRMPGLLNSEASLDLVAHVIQVALTPIFLLSGIATLLNMFATRLARVADLVVQSTKAMEQANPDESADLARHLLRLRRRSIALDAAVVLGAIAAAATVHRSSLCSSGHCAIRPSLRCCSPYSGSRSFARSAPLRRS